MTKLQDTIKSFTLPTNEAKSIEAIMKQMKYPKEDVIKWWSGVRWVQDQRDELDSAKEMKGQDAATTTVSKAVLKLTLDDLEKAGVVQSPVNGWDCTRFTPAATLID